MSRKVASPSPPHYEVVTQAQLVELHLLKLRAKRALAEYQIRRDHIRKALEAGARVEPGLHSVRISNRLLLD
jgi:hypothetical protein